MSLSKEDRCMIQYLKDSKVLHRITSTTNHSANTAAGYPSRHVMPGTDGMGLAIDSAGPTSSRDSKALGDIFWAFMKVEKQLHELIYAGPQTSFNIKAGKRVAKYAQSGHHDHVHTAVNKGVFIVWPHLSPQEKTLRIPNAVPGGFAILANDDLVITSKDGAIYHFDADGVHDEIGYQGGYNAHPALWGGSSPTTNRECIGVYAQGNGYVQVFDDGARYHWGV